MATSATATVGTRHFSFELVAPEKVELLSMEESVTLPGEEGDFMVFTGHTPLLAGLRAGVVSVHKPGGDTHYFITGGFADIGNAHCIILTPHVTPVAQLNVEKLTAELQKVERELSDAREKHLQDHLHEQITTLSLKLEAARKHAS